ncbi:MAG: alkaline phosphatase [Parvularculaceae bacterium]
MFVSRLALAIAFVAPAAAFAAPASDEADSYFKAGQDELAARAAVKPIRHGAKNVILFIGDGMDPTTVAASRIYDGQTRGEEGEENYLSFEKFPHLAMSKTYNTNAQVPDSAGTMSAIMTGVKTKIGVISLTDKVEHGVCASEAAAMTATVGELAKAKGMGLGVVSTSLLTDATPAAVYAHAATRSWQRDTSLSEEAIQNGCKDIARQLIDFSYGDGVDVAMGGGRGNFLPIEAKDPEYDDQMGWRRDGRNLTQEWTAKGGVYVYDEKGFAAIDPKKNPKVLGLFEPSVMEYEADRDHDPAGEPSLVNMTKKSIEILSNNKKGYFLMVEAGRIDHANHAGNAARALKDTQELSEAVAAARAMTNENDTLIIVTADHGHTMSFSGYPKKGNNILGLVKPSMDDEPQKDGYALAGDGKPYTTLAYANGPGSVLVGQKSAGERPELTEEEVLDLNFRQQSLVPSRSETHGGQDVTIYASGPDAYLFGGVVEENYIFHVIDKALGLRGKK